MGGSNSYLILEYGNLIGISTTEELNRSERVLKEILYFERIKTRKTQSGHLSMSLCVKVPGRPGQAARPAFCLSFLLFMKKKKYRVKKKNLLVSGRVYFQGPFFWDSIYAT